MSALRSSCAFRRARPQGSKAQPASRTDACETV
jgi:hypothetical protein